MPNKEAYNKLSNQDKKGFDKAAKEAGLPTKAGPLKGTTPGHFTMPETIQMKKPGLPTKKASIAKKIEKIPTLPSKKLPTNTKMGHGNKPIDFERGGYGQKLDPKKAGFPGDYTPKKEAAPLRKKTGKRTVEKLPEGGKRVRVTDKEGRVKKEVIKGKGYRGVTKFDKQGREVVSKSRSGSMLNPERKSKTKTSYQDDFSNKKSEVKLTTKERGKKKKVIKAKYKKDNRDFFPG